MLATKKKLSLANSLLKNSRRWFSQLCFILEREAGLNSSGCRSSSPSWD